MTRINNLFFLYLLISIGYGVGYECWDKTYSYYVFMILLIVVGMLIIISEKFSTKEAHVFFGKQLFFTAFISLCCVFINSDTVVYRIIDFSFYIASLGSFILWILTIRNNEDDQENNQSSTGEISNSSLAC